MIIFKYRQLQNWKICAIHMNIQKNVSEQKWRWVSGEGKDFILNIIAVGGSED